MVLLVTRGSDTAQDLVRLTLKEISPECARSTMKMRIGVMKFINFFLWVLLYLYIASLCGLIEGWELLLEFAQGIFIDGLS